MNRPLILGILAVLLVAVLAGGAWAHSASYWLWDDFRAGYEAGELRTREEPGTLYEACWEATEQKYGTTPDGTSEDATAFWAGCERGRAGLSNDFWRVNEYLAD